jgi:uncharacterized UBP type Zn finger protein
MRWAVSFDISWDECINGNTCYGHRWIPEQAGPVADEAIVSELVDIGFPKVRCEKAAIQTLNTGVEETMNWILAHMDDPG